MINNNSNNRFCISVKNLVKSYNTSNIKRNAIDNISFDVDYGTVFGFLGPNGAGKTTTIKILTGILQPTTGSVKIFEKDIKNRFPAAALPTTGCWCPAAVRWSIRRRWR
jgi:ABC-type multidrug transport system ATPase subunit